MKLYKIRNKTTGKYLLSIGNTGHGRWHDKGKVYARTQDARIALAHLERRFKGVLEFQKKSAIGWKNLNDINRIQIENEIVEATQEMLQTVEVVEYNVVEATVHTKEEFQHVK